MAYGNHFLDSLSADDAAALKPLLRRVRLEVGQITVEQGAVITTLHFPIDAQLANVVVYADGAAIETAVVGREGMSGLAPFMAEEPCTWRIVARAPGEAWAASAQAVRERALTSAPMMARMLRLTHVYQAQAALGAACNVTHLTPARVARWLLTSADLTPDAPLLFTQEELGALLGAQRTTVNEATNKLKDAGGISYSRGVIRIRDRAVLENAACECYAQFRAFTDRAGLLPKGD